MHPKWMHPERYFEPYKTSPLPNLMPEGKFYFFGKSKWAFSESFRLLVNRLLVISHHAQDVARNLRSTGGSGISNPTKCRLRIARHLSRVCQSAALPKGSRADLSFSNLFGFEVSGVNLSSLRRRQINLARFRVFNHLF